jgi:hypothetical protein
LSIGFTTSLKYISFDKSELCLQISHSVRIQLSSRAYTVPIDPKRFRSSTLVKTTAWEAGQTACYA